MGEFDLTKKYLAPLTGDAAPAFGLTDDAAHLVEPIKNAVITTDTMVESVHFFSDDDPALVMRKVLRVSLSDLAAKAAVPIGYTLNIATPADTAEAWFRAAHDGLMLDQETFGVKLIGGDSTRTNGPVVLTVTAIGEGPDSPILRGAGQMGEGVFLSGPIGGAALALSLREAGVAVPLSLEHVRMLPEPRLDLRQTLRAYASSAIDVSDGLIADLGKLLPKGLGIDLDCRAIPTLPEVAKILMDDPAAWSTALTGGDDYEVLFTAATDAVEGASLLGILREGNSIVTHEGTSLDLITTGYQHF